MSKQKERYKFSWELADPVLKIHRAEVPGPNGIVSAGHPLAATAGMRILVQGGSAADAAVAAMAVLNVVESWGSGAGGNGYAMVYDRQSSGVHSLCFHGAGPKYLDPHHITHDELLWGPKSATVPGAFGGWISLALRFGRLSLKELLAPAIQYAREGHALDSNQAYHMSRSADKFAKYPTSAAIYLTNGRTPDARSIFKMEPLARTFEALVSAEEQVIRGGGSREAGLRAAHDLFYKGKIAEECISYYRQNGGFLRREDFAEYEPKWNDPVTTDYKGYSVYSSPPPSRGGLELCMQLNYIEDLDISRYASGSTDSLHLMAEAIKLAKSDVYAYVADPAFARIPVKGMTSKEYAALRASMINMASAMQYPGPGDLRPFDNLAPPPPLLPAPVEDEEMLYNETTSLSVVDRDGNAVAVTTTLGGGFGTFEVVGNTGLLFNNGMRIGATSPYPNTVNYLEAGKIPLLNNAPTVVLRKGAFHLVFGTPGGETIGQTQFQALINLIDYDMGVQEAIEAPRFIVDARPNFYRPGADTMLFLESRFTEESQQGLRARGHKVRTIGEYAIGSVQAIRRVSSGAFIGGADIRRMAAAVGW
jgi:gamma-glutamyltranspeptidase/glutathione hydrolase